MDLDTIRRDFERLLTITAERHQQLDMREQELAAGMELLSVDPAVASAYEQGQADAYRRVQRLIELQLQHLAPQSSSRSILRHLSRMVEERK
jgi:hypothetical protein